MNIFTDEECKLMEFAFSLSEIYHKPLDEHFINHIYYEIIYLNHPEKLKSLLEYSNEMKTDFLKTFKNKPQMNVDLSHTSLIFNPRSFVLITDFGGVNGQHSQVCQLYLFQICTVLEKKEIEMSDEIYHRFLDEDERNPISFRMRSYQLLCLYMLYRHGREHHPSDYEVILRFLWNSIPDPFLTISDFTESFDWMKPETLQKIRAAWDWYCQLVRDPDSEGKCPRPLQHLCKCAVRRRLGECFRLPGGVKKLKVPKFIKQYLLLRDIEIGLMDETTVTEDLL